MASAFDIFLAVVTGNSMERQEDGSARVPLLFREALRHNEQSLAQIGKDHPEWVDIIKSDDLEAFQDMLRGENTSQTIRKPISDQFFLDFDIVTSL